MDGARALAERLWQDSGGGTTGAHSLAELAAGLRRPAGCEGCRHTGYRGRTTIGEMLSMNDRLRELLLSGAGELALTQGAVAAGMTTMYRDGLMKAFRGETTIEEVLRVTRMS